MNDVNEVKTQPVQNMLIRDAYCFKSNVISPEVYKGSETTRHTVSIEFDGSYLNEIISKSREVATANGLDYNSCLNQYGFPLKINPSKDKEGNIKPNKYLMSALVYDKTSFAHSYVDNEGNTIVNSTPKREVKGCDVGLGLYLRPSHNDNHVGILATISKVYITKERSLGVNFDEMWISDTTPSQQTQGYQQPNVAPQMPQQVYNQPQYQQPNVASQMPQQIPQQVYNQPQYRQPNVASQMPQQTQGYQQPYQQPNPLFNQPEDMTGFYADTVDEVFGFGEP